MANQQATRERLTQACYRHILPHMEKYNAEPDIVKCLPLMDPDVFAGFAVQACTDAAALVVKLGHRQYKEYARNGRSHTLQHLDCEDDEDAVCTAMLDGIGGFKTALDRFLAAFQRFCGLAGQVNAVAFQNGADLGEWAVGAFGGVTGLLVGMTAGYFSGKRLDRQMQAESEHLQREFNIMLQAYDQAMGVIIAYGVNALAVQRQELIVAVRNAH